MATLEVLRAQGWHLSTEGLNKLYENEISKDIKSITRKALDIDLREIGAPVISNEINKDVFGPVILQILKLRNISASKAKPESQLAPRMLKLSLTDGHTICQALEIKLIPALSLEHTVPGTKVLIDGAQIISGCLILNLQCCKILGGNVPMLVERWQLSKLMPSHMRVTEDGPPAWVNFGCKIITNLNNQGFKSLESKSKENSKEDAEFQNQRQDAISEAAQGAVKKIFGGGVKTPQVFSSNEYNNANHTSNVRASTKSVRNKGREKNELEKADKPLQKVSLFDFLEDKLPPSESSKNNINNVKIFSNDSKNICTETIKDNSSKSKIQNRYIEKRENDYSRNSTGIKYQNERKNVTVRKENETRQNIHNRYQQRSDRKEIENRQDMRYQNERSNRYSYERKEFDTRQNTERYQSEKPPRFQKQRTETSTKSVLSCMETEPERLTKDSQNNSRDVRVKPDANNFISKLANEINNISLYNSKYENQKLNKVANSDTSNNIWKWKIGDKCMAKYWEDNKFYEAVVTGVTNRTCMVEFLEYGNFEEVLHCDCIPITTEKNEISKLYSDNQQISGNLEFKRGKNRPFVRNPNQIKSFHGNKNYET